MSGKKSLKINALLNGLKQCFGIIFPLVTFPYISRVLGNDGFGKYSFSWSIVSYFILIAGLGISTYTIREGARIRDDKQQISILCSEAYTINIITTALSFVVLAALILMNTKIRSYSLFIIIQSSALLLNLFGRDWINSIYEDYLYITIRYLIIQVVSMGLMFLIIRTPDDVWKYCVIAVFASFGGNLFNIVYVKKYVKTRITFKPKIKKHLPPLLILFATQIAITIYVNADITMLGFYENDSVVGIYSLASKVYGMIKTIINAMVVVMLPRMTYIIEHQRDLYKMALRKSSSYLLILLLPIACGTFMLSKEILYIAGGTSYLSGHVALKILSIAMLFAVMGSFFMNTVLIANRKEKYCLQATLISAMINVLFNFIAIPLWGMNGAAVTTIIAEGTNLLILIFYCKSYFKVSDFDKTNIIQCIIGTAFVCILCTIIHRYLPDLIITIMISVIGSLSVYFLALIIMKNIYVIDMLKLIMSRFRRGGN